MSLLPQRSAAIWLALLTCCVLTACAVGDAKFDRGSSMQSHQEKVTALLTSFETGDRSALKVSNPDHYIQHNLAVPDGVAGLAARLDARPAGSTKVRIVRIFTDGEFVFSQTEYNFSGHLTVGFDIFRFENDLIVEHWDNLQPEADKPSPSGHTMLDGPVSVTDLENTEANKTLMQTYMADLLSGHREKIPGYFNGNNYIQHNPWVADNLSGLIAGLTALAAEGKAVQYTRVERVLGQGNFVLVVADGMFGAQETAFYDLYRIENGKVAEHWDTLQAIPPRSEWKNPNGKF